MPYSYVVLKHSETDADALAGIQIEETGHVAFALRKLVNFLKRAQVGAMGLQMDIRTGMEAATGTITLSSHVATDTVTVGTVTLTCDTDYAEGGDDTETADNLATAINAHATLGALVIASADTGVVTLTAKVPGLIGNQIALAISAHGSVSASYMASGDTGTERNHSMGSETSN